MTQQQPRDPKTGRFISKLQQQRDNASYHTPSGDTIDNKMIDDPNNPLGPDFGAQDTKKEKFPALGGASSSAQATGANAGGDQLSVVLHFMMQMQQQQIEENRRRDDQLASLIQGLALNNKNAGASQQAAPVQAAASPVEDTSLVKCLRQAIPQYDGNPNKPETYFVFTKKVDAFFLNVTMTYANQIEFAAAFFT